MRILVINGSPKGENSITLQTVRYLEALHPEHTFDVLHVGQRIRALEKDFAPALEAISRAELLLFSYPVYTFIAPCQLHRFIELLKASQLDLRGKFAAQLTTSKHFYDVTAHRYIEDNCADLSLAYVGGLSADMDDLLKESGRNEAEAFFQHTLWRIARGYAEPVHALKASYSPVAATLPEDACEKKGGDVVIVTDCETDNTQLAGMIARFQAVLPHNSRVVNIREYPIKGGCLGCFGCAVSGKCVYTDGFDEFLRTDIQKAQAIVYAFTIRDHSMGARFKMYDDRQFCNGHRTVTMGSPVGYLISGSYETEINVQTIINARAQVGGNFFAGAATDERDTDAQIDRLAASIDYALENSYRQPSNFYGVGGMKIFRDLIYTMRGMMRADHKFFKSHGQYDFPHKKRGTILAMYLVGALIASPTLKSKVNGKMTDGMLMPYKKVLDSIKR